MANRWDKRMDLYLQTESALLMEYFITEEASIVAGGAGSTYHVIDYRTSNTDRHKLNTGCKATATLL